MLSLDSYLSSTYSNSASGSFSVALKEELALAWLICLSGYALLLAHDSVLKWMKKPARR